MVVAIPTVLVLVPTILIVGLAVVLHGRKTGWSDLVCHRWRTVTGISLVEICCGCLRDVFLDVISGARTEMSACEEVRSNYLFNSEHGRYVGGGSACLSPPTQQRLSCSAEPYVETLAPPPITPDDSLSNQRPPPPLSVPKPLQPEAELHTKVLDHLTFKAL
ncbi:hypothetical protein Tco_0540150 [Tanacetum coccineum]